MSQGSSNPTTTITFKKEALTAFGELRVANTVPVTGWTFTYNIMTDIVDTATTGTGTVTQSASRAKLSSSAAINSSAMVATRRALRYTPGVGGRVLFTTVYETAGTAGNTRIHGIGNGTDGFFFGFDGITFGILYRRSSVDTWIPQTSWNFNTCPWLNKTYGNIYEINYQWLGYGWIFFSMEDPTTGRLTLVHAIKYSNTTADVSILNPNLPIEMYNANNGICNTDCVMYSPSAMGFAENVTLELPHGPLDIPRQATGAVNASTGAVVLLVENQTTLNGVTNRINLILESLNLTADGSKTANFVIVRDPVMAAPPPVIVYTNVLLNQSPVRYSTTAGMTYTGGTVIWSGTLMKLDRMTESIEHIQLLIAPGESFIVAFTSAANTDVDVTALWMEGI
jgi:hypothetical protein